jgi:hypothetical protein
VDEAGEGLSAEDLTARIAELAAIIEAGLREDEAAAQDFAQGSPTPWSVETSYVHDANGRLVLLDEYHWDAVQYFGRHGPDRDLRRVAATRALVAEVLAEGHYSDESGYYSCSQARDWVFEKDPAPGSGCSDRERAGKPCDCGRDAGVVLRLGIIAAEWEG